MRTIKYFGIGSLSASILLLFAGVFVLSAFFFFAFCVLSVVYAINNRDNYKKETETKKRSHNPDYTLTTWWYMENCDGGDCSGA